MARFDVIGVGIAACDYLTTVDRFPAINEKVRSKDLLITGGGTVGTALVAVSRLGLHAAFAGSLGDDDFGRFILAGLEREKVDTTLATVVSGARSPFAFVAATAPHRTVFSVRPTTPPLVIDDRCVGEYLDARFLHLDGAEEEAAVQLARAARERGVGVSLDLQRVRSSSDALIAVADVAIVSAAFARERYGDVAPTRAVTQLLRPGMQLAAITLGELGVVATDGNEIWEIPAEPVEVVDTTGAGDVFHGAALVGLLRGMSAEATLRYANRVAGIACGALGGRTAIPYREEFPG